MLPAGIEGMLCRPPRVIPPGWKAGISFQDCVAPGSFPLLSPLWVGTIKKKSSQGGDESRSGGVLGKGAHCSLSECFISSSASAALENHSNLSFS